jgi:acetolactate decarboxylase
MSARWMRSVAISLCLSVSLIACVPLPARDLLFQTSTISALQAGDFDGELPIGTLKRYGDFGVGTFDALDGEMVVLDGEVYQLKADGTAALATDTQETPFAVVTYFAADQTATLNEALDCAGLQTELDALLPDLNGLYAIKVVGTWTSLNVRAPFPESEPYPPLSEALADQALFDLQQVTGTLVGFRLPDYLAGVNSTGYHFHFLSEDRDRGGHVLDCQAENLTVEIDALDRLWVDGISPNLAQ